MMIARTWRGRAALNRPDDYVNHFKASVLPELKAIEGFLGATLMRRTRAADIEFQVITRWASLAAIKAFAGEDFERAVVEPGAVAALKDFDDTVAHYDVVSSLDA
jgi:heme-degrading monooxygenase HmoA